MLPDEALDLLAMQVARGIQGSTIPLTPQTVAHYRKGLTPRDSFRILTKLVSDLADIAHREKPTRKSRSWLELVFRLVLKDRIMCTRGHAITEPINPMASFHLTLDLPPGAWTEMRLEDILAHHMRSRPAGNRRCAGAGCGGRLVAAGSEPRFASAPRVLVLHVERFPRYGHKHHKRIIHGDHIDLNNYSLPGVVRTVSSSLATECR